MLIIIEWKQKLILKTSFSPSVQCQEPDRDVTLMTALYERCMVMQRHIRQSLVIKLKSCWKVLGSGLKAQEAGEPTFCSWNNSCLLLLFSFSSSFSLETSKHMVDFRDDTKTRQMLFKTPSVTLTVVFCQE